MTALSALNQLTQLVHVCSEVDDEKMKEELAGKILALCDELKGTFSKQIIDTLLREPSLSKKKVNVEVGTLPSPENADEFASLLKKTREEKGLTIGALSHSAHVSNRSIAIIEKLSGHSKSALNRIFTEGSFRQKRVWTRTLMKLAEALKIPLDKIFGKNIEPDEERTS